MVIYAETLHMCLRTEYVPSYRICAFVQNDGTGTYYVCQTQIPSVLHLRLRLIC